MLTHVGTNTITTERLILRQFEYKDDESMLKNWVADEKIQSLYSEPVYSTKEAVRELLNKYIGSYDKSDYYRWAVVERKSGECIGQIAFFLVDSKNHFAEIEYCIGSEFQCNGYATEATKAIIAYGFNRISFHKIQICTKTINAPSKRVIEKCGFTYEGTLRDFFYMNGEYIGRLYFSMLKSEFEKNNLGLVK
jgi:ribosomal-protein-alanine N-acetyltransferase